MLNDVVAKMVLFLYLYPIKYIKYDYSETDSFILPYLNCTHFV